MKAKQCRRSCWRIGGKANAGFSLQAGIAVFMLMICLNLRAEMESSRIYRINLPGQNVATALTSLSEQTDMLVLFPYDIAETRQSNPVVGEFTLQQALEILLRGSGLTGGLSDKGVINISLDGAANSSKDGEKSVNPNNNNLRITKKATILGAILSIFTPVAGNAQGTESRGASSIELEEIVVTARKREESLQDIPISVTAFTSSDLEAKGVKNLVDLAFSIPNVSLQDRGGSFGTSFGIRGISSNVRNAGIEDSVGLYVDGVYIGRPQFFRLDSEDIQQVEVLRGPQGTLFGKNTVAGALNVTTKQPNREEIEGKIAGRVGNYGSMRFGGYISAPLSDSIAAKVVVSKTDSDGWIKNRFNDETLQGVDEVYVRGQVDLYPADNLDVSVTVDYTETDNNTVFSQPFVPVNLASPVQVGPQLDDHTVVFRDGPVFDKTDNLGASISIQYELESEYSLALVAAIRDMDFKAGFDDDNTARDFSNSIFTDTAKQKSVELRINSPSWDRWDFVAGLLWFDQEVQSVRGTGPTVDTPGPSAFGLITGAGGVETTSIGAYFHSNISITDALDLSVGMRWTDDKKTGQWAQDTFDPVARSGVIPPDITVPSVTDSWSEFTPTAALTYRINEDSIAYAKYSRGFKAGSMLPDIINIANPSEFVLDSETVDSYEAGVKTTLFDQKLRFNGNFFYMDYKNLQVINLSNLQGGGFIGSNSGSAELKGIELDVLWLPTDHFQVSVNAGHTDAEVKDLLRAGADLSGNIPRNAPKWTTNVQMQYRYPLANFGGELVVIGESSYRGSVFYDPENNPQIRQGGYSLYNARVGYVSSAGKWSVYLWGENLSDKKYATFGRVGPFAQQQFGYATPFTFGLDASVRF